MSRSIKLYYNEILKSHDGKYYRFYKAQLDSWICRAMGNIVEIQYIEESGRIIHCMVELIDDRSFTEDMSGAEGNNRRLYVCFIELSSKYCPICRDLAEKARAALRKYAAKFPRITHKFIDSVRYLGDFEYKGDYVSSNHGVGYVTLFDRSGDISCEAGIHSTGKIWSCETDITYYENNHKVLDNILWKKTFQYCTGLFREKLCKCPGFADVIVA